MRLHVYSAKTAVRTIRGNYSRLKSSAQNAPVVGCVLPIFLDAKCRRKPTI